MTTSTKSFGKIRSIIFPIHFSELKKFIPMTVMIFAILFNYTILRNMKDTLVVNATGAGTLSFLKLYCVTPAALLFVVLFVKLNSIFDREKLLYVIITPFLIFFAAFAFILYPNINSLHPSAETVQGLYSSFPALKGFIDIYAYWIYSLFFILAELWGSVCVQVLFWQFANQIVNIEQSKRFYALFIAYGNVSLIFCGLLAKFLANSLPSMLSPSADLWLYTIQIQMSLVFLMGLGIIFSYRYLNTKVIPFDTTIKDGAKKEKKKKPGLVESFKIVFTSRHLSLIAALVIAYGISINLVEVQFKNQVKQYFGENKLGFNAFMNSYSQWTGVAALVFTGIAGSGILKKLSWFTAALLTPLTIGVGGVIFFIAILSSSVIQSLALNPIAVAAFSGAVIVAASKVMKYALFDTTKAMAYIPLSNELKSNGGAAVEVVGGRLGKSGGAFVQSTLLMVMSTTNVLSIAPITSAIFVVVCVLWFYAVKALSVEMKKTEKKD